MKNLKTLLLLIFFGTSIGASAQCILNASFTYTISSGNIYFTNTSTNEPAIAYYDWYIAAQFSNAENAVFSTAGFGSTETVCFTVYDSLWACYDSVCMVINFDSTGGCNINADFTYSQSGDDITFSSTSTGVPAGATYDWWYNGQSSSDVSPTLSSIGAVDGDYMCLTIYDSSWTCYDSICMPVYLDSTGGGGCNLDASFTYVAYGGNIYFTNTSTGVPVGATFDWWYGSQNSADENPTFNSVLGGEYVCLTVYDSSWACYDSTCYLVFIDSTMDTTLTINQVDADINFNFYPNPVDNVLNISFTNNGNVDLIQIYDAMGRLVRNEIIATDEFDVLLDVSDLPEGLYILTVFDNQSPEHRKSERFIKR